MHGLEYCKLNNLTVKSIANLKAITSVAHTLSGKKIENVTYTFSMYKIKQY